MVAGANFLSDLISHKSDNPQKRKPYESGIATKGPTWVQFKIEYYLFAILFLIFDVEIAPIGIGDNIRDSKSCD